MGVPRDMRRVMFHFMVKTSWRKSTFGGLPCCGLVTQNLADFQVPFSLQILIFSYFLLPLIFVFLWLVSIVGEESEVELVGN